MTSTITTTTWANELLNIYDRDKFFDPMERRSMPLSDMFKEADDVRPNGAQLIFRGVLHSSKRAGFPSETGDLPGGGSRSTVQLAVTPVQVASSLEISQEVIDRAKDDGSFAGDAVHEAIVEAAEELYLLVERMLMVSHGTGRLGTVLSTVTSTQFTMAAPQFSFNVRAGMKIDLVDTDTSGSVAVSGAEILDVNDQTHVITVDSTITATATYGVYLSGYYGTAPIGIRGMVDDGTYYPTFFGKARASYPRLNSIVDSNSSVVRAYDEKIVRKALHQLVRSTGPQPDWKIICNSGVVSAHLDQTVKDRQYIVSGKEVPAYNTGYNEGDLAFTFQNNRIPIKIISDCPARELFIISPKTFRKHTLKKADWMPGNAGMGPLMPTPSTGTYKLTYTAGMVARLNFSNRKPIANAVIRDLADSELAEDSV